MELKKTQRPLLTFILSTVVLFVGTVSTATITSIAVKKSVFNIVSKIYVDGEFVSSPRIISRADQKAVIKISDKGDSDSSDFIYSHNDKRNSDYLKPALTALKKTVLEYSKTE